MPTLQPPTRLRLLFCLAALSVASGCARSSEGVSGEREKPRYEPKKNPEADEALKKAEGIAQVSPKPKAIEAYLNVSKAYAETTAAQEALYRAGVLSFESGDYVNARKAFNQLLYENPLFDKAQDAKLKLGLAAPCRRAGSRRAAG